MEELINGVGYRLLLACAMIHFKEGCRLLYYLLWFTFTKKLMVQNTVQPYLVCCSMCVLQCQNAMCHYTACVQWMMNFSLLSKLQNISSGSPHDAVNICLVIVEHLWATRGGMTLIKRHPKKLHTLTFKMLYSIMDTLNTINSVTLIHCCCCGKRFSFISYHKLYQVMMIPIALYIYAKPMGFSRVHHTFQ